MQAFTFVHAADLHLDAVLPAPPGEDGAALRELLANAVFTALDRLTNLCLAEQAAFLVIAGDVFHGGAGSLKANFKLTDSFRRLGEHGIEVFWARGNHDPLNRSDNTMRWPDNVHVFSPDGERLDAGGTKILAELHGISHKGGHERANLAATLQGGGPGFHMGVLHCAVSGAPGQHAAYAPCSLADLTGSGKNYWALGHVHKPSILAVEPPVVYPGSLQGLHINESGPHGCYVVAVNAHGRAEPRFVSLAPVRWEKLALDIASAESLDALEEQALESIRTACAKPEHKEPWPDLLLLRLELVGRAPLDASLRGAGGIEDLAARLNHELAALDGSLPYMARIKDILLSTSPDLDIEALLQSDNLVGETLRQAQTVIAGLKKNVQGEARDMPSLSAALADTAWGPSLLADLNELYGESRMEDADALPGADELTEMAREAAALCLHLFEVEP